MRARSCGPVRTRSDTAGNTTSILALLYDIHGNRSALDAVLADAREQGATSYFIGGDVALFGPHPLESVQRLQELEPATWIRGNGERWTADPEAAPEPVRGATTAAREALGADLVAKLDALAQSAALGEPGSTRAWHGSPVSDVRSFQPEPAEEDAELLGHATEARLIFGHTHLPFRRSTVSGTELVNPGSVGMPFDGDHRAAYALLHDDDAIEHRRVGYDHAAVPRALRERYGDASWVDIIEFRLTHARLAPD